MLPSDRTDASPSRDNPFCAHDKVKFRAGIGRDHTHTYEVHHVERNMVFVITKNGLGREKLVDYSWTMFKHA